MRYPSICLGLLLFPILATPLYGQIDRAGGYGSEERASFEDVIFSKDTLDVKYFEFDTRDTLLVFQDTFVQYFHEFELNHIRDQGFFHLGYPGSAARPLILRPQVATGFRLGLHSHDPYRMDDDQFRFYSMKKAITTAFYTQGQTQQDGIFRARFARNFKDRVQFSLDYTRTNNQGSYNRQSGRGTNIGAGFWYHSKNQRFNVFLQHYSNVYDQENNGGVTTDTLFNDELYQERSGIPVALGEAVTRDQQKAYQLTSTYRLFGRDSVDVDRGLLAEYVFRLDHWRFRYSDSSPDSTYYTQDFTDRRGIRHLLENRKIRNTFNLAFKGKLAEQQFKVGLSSIINRINQEPNRFSVTEWRAHGKLDWTLGTQIGLKTAAEINLHSQYTGYMATGTLSINLKKAGSLAGTLTLNSKPPSLIERSTWLSQIQVWDFDFKNNFTNHLQVTYLLPSINLRLSAGQVLSTNQIYWDTQGRPAQEATLTTLNYLEAYKMFRLGNFYNENRIVLQATGNKAVFTVPDWHTQQSIYYSGSIFRKKMQLKTGFDLRMHADINGITYRPHIGQFTLDDRSDILWYPALDYHISFQVRFLRAFAMLQNILQPLRSDIYYQTSRYPQPDLLFRVGLSWVFIN